MFVLARAKQCGHESGCGGLQTAMCGPALLLVPTVLLPGGLPCPSETHCTIPTSALVFGGWEQGVLLLFG